MEEWGKTFLCFIMFTLFLPCIVTLSVSGTRMDGLARTSGITIEREDGTDMDLEEFLPYMVAAQIDLEAEQEVLKAQAVIARTNVMRELNGKDKIKLSELTAAYLTPETMETGFGEIKRREVMGRLKRAVEDTFMKTIKYKENYIEALYHSVSIGTTISSKEMFGKERVYLQSVDSSQDVESKDYMTVVDVNMEELADKLKDYKKWNQLNSDRLKKELEIKEKTQNGYVKKVRIGEEIIKGEDWVKLFSLNSANFYLEELEDGLRMIVLGKGHGVGLSQYGANVLAKAGWTYEEILKKYYPETNIV